MVYGVIYCFILLEYLKRQLPGEIALIQLISVRQGEIVNGKILVSGQMLLRSSSQITPRPIYFMPIIAAQSSWWHFAGVPKITSVGAVRVDLTVVKV